MPSCDHRGCRPACYLAHANGSAAPEQNASDPTGGGPSPSGDCSLSVPSYRSAHRRHPHDYRHVDILNAAGIPATVVHAPDGFSCTWFDHNTRITGARSVALSRQDVLVVPEWYGPYLKALPVGPRIVVFNQNAYMTFGGLEDNVATGAPYRGIPGLQEILVVSRDNADYIRFAFPELTVTQVRNAIDPALFYPPDRSPGRRIAWMPRGGPMMPAKCCDCSLHTAAWKAGKWSQSNTVLRRRRLACCAHAPSS